jgi:hypothetical protein
MAKRIVVDDENSAEAWWDTAREATDIPPAVRFLLETDAGEVVLSDDDALDVMAWAERLLGRSEYARNPLLLQDAGAAVPDPEGRGYRRPRR